MHRLLEFTERFWESLEDRYISKQHTLIPLPTKKLVIAHCGEIAVGSPPHLHHTSYSHHQRQQQRQQLQLIEMRLRHHHHHHHHYSNDAIMTVLHVARRRTFRRHHSPLSVTAANNRRHAFLHEITTRPES